MLDVGIWDLVLGIWDLVLGISDLVLGAASKQGLGGQIL